MADVPSGEKNFAQGKIATRGNPSTLHVPFYEIDGVERGRRMRPPADLRRGCHAKRAGVAPSTLVKYN